MPRANAYSFRSAILSPTPVASQADIQFPSPIRNAPTDIRTNTALTIAIAVLDIGSYTYQCR